MEKDARARAACARGFSGIALIKRVRYASLRMRLLGVLLLLAGPVSLWAAPADGELYTEAESRFLNKNYTAALVEYDEFIQLYPSSDLIADVQYRRGVCLYELGNYPQAADVLAEVALRYRWTRFIDAVPLWRGLAEYRMQRYTPSLVFLNEYLGRGKDPNLVPRALLCKSLDLEALQKPAEAADAARQLMRDYPRSQAYAPAVVLLSSLLLKEKAYDELEQLATQTDLSSLPDGLRQEFLWNRAEGLWANNRQGQALPIYQELRDARFDISLGAYRRLFSAAQSQGDLTRMQSLATEMESHFAGKPEVMADTWAALGVDNYRKGNRDAAWLYLQRAWALRGTAKVDSSVPIYLARILQDRKDNEGARALLQDYVNQPGASSESAMLALGLLARDSGELALADTILSKYLQTFPKSDKAPQAAALLGDVELREGKLDQGSAVVSRYLAATTGASRAGLLRLKAEIDRRRGDFAAAAAALREYRQIVPDDMDAGVDYLEDQLLAKDYASVQQGASDILSSQPGLASKNPRAWILCQYMLGLSRVAAKDYTGAVTTFGKIDAGAAQANGLEVILPYLGYYLAWSYSKTADFKDSARISDDLAQKYSNHVLAPKIYFLAGWSYYNLGDFAKASSYFLQASQVEPDKSSAGKDYYLYAKSLIGAKKYSDAQVALQQIINATPPSPFAENALFDFAGVQAATGSPNGAVDTYRTLATQYPNSPLAEEATYRLAETLLNNYAYKAAAAAFTDYRRKYPAGRLYDAALYWGGEADYQISVAFHTGPPFDAALLWEQLANSYPKSPFRAPALRRAAEVYAQANDLQRALDLYDRFIKDYPDEARLAKADIEAEKLRYEIQGVGSTEADLMTRIAHSTGTNKLDATTELARLYIYSGQDKVDKGYQMLQQVVAQGSGMVAARAQDLEGEYFYRKGDLLEAARRFVAAAAAGASDSEFAASTLYRAAEMMKLGDRPDQVQAIVKKMTDAYPASPWTLRAEKLMEAAK